jgi:hypothetical protein
MTFEEWQRWRGTVGPYVKEGIEKGLLKTPTSDDDAGADARITASSLVMQRGLDRAQERAQELEMEMPPGTKGRQFWTCVAEIIIAQKTYGKRRWASF